MLLVLIWTWPLAAQSVNARFSTSLYTWERQLSETESQNRLRLYQTLQLTVGQMAGQKLSAHFYGQLSGDLAQSAEDDPIPRVYNFYLQWYDRKGVLERVKLGRLRSYAGVAYGTVDGVDVSLRFGKYFKLGGFVGALVPFSNRVEVGNWDDHHAFGLRLSTRQLLGSTILLSFVQRNRRPAPYAQPGRYTQKRLTFQSLEQRLVGIDVYRRFGRRATAYARLDYDLLQERVRRGQVELNLQPAERWRVTLDFMHRAPLLEANSIFWVFQTSTIQDFGLRASWQVRPAWSLYADVGYVNYASDETVRFGLGVRGPYGFLGYNFRSGYGGASNGVNANFRYPLTLQVGVIASLGFSRYSLFREDFDKYSATTGSLGFYFRPARSFSLDVLGQALSNRFYKRDARIFVKANYWIFTSKR